MITNDYFIDRFTGLSDQLVAIVEGVKDGATLEWVLLRLGVMDGSIRRDIAEYKSLANVLKEDEPVSEIEILRRRVKYCSSVDEAEKMALIRGIQEIALAVGLSPLNASVHQVVEAVQALANKENPNANG